MYDCCHLVAELDENKVGTTYEFDHMGRMSKMVNANGEETAYTYNEEGWLMTITDPRGKVTTNDYDELGRLKEVAYPGGWEESYTYWEPGMLKSKTNSKGLATTTVNYTYDDLYRLIKKDFPSGTDTEFEWDSGGRRTKMTDASGEKRYVWDDDNRLESITQGPAAFTTNHNYLLEYDWSGANQKTGVDLTVRTLSKQSWVLDYTDDGYLDTVTNPDSEVTKHEYLDDGRLKKITLRSSAMSNKATREFFYQDTDASHDYVANKNRHLRKTLDKTQGGSTITSFDYELDAAGRRLSMTDKDGKYHAYQLDPLGQLKTETKWSAKTPGTRSLQYGYSLDPNGNRLQQFKDGGLTAYEFGDNNELIAMNAVDYTYDHFGNRTEEIAGTTTTYTWDFESHMLTTSNSGSEASDSHAYDGDGRRMASSLSNAAPITQFVYDETVSEYPCLICEFTDSSGTFAYRALNTWGIGLINTNRGGTKRYFHFDGLGSTWALTDDTASEQDTYAYSAFGVQESSSGSSVNPFRFVGQWGYYDDAAMGSIYGLHLLGVRYMDVDRGVFLSWDPAIYTGRDYSYCLSSPTERIDPLGLLSLGYGKYCGPRNGPGTPINKVDACCRTHDKCLASWIDWINPLKKWTCECALCDCVNSARWSCGFDLGCIEAAALIGAYACLQCRGLPF